MLIWKCPLVIERVSNNRKKERKKEASNIRTQSIEIYEKRKFYCGRFCDSLKPIPFSMFFSSSSSVCVWLLFVFFCWFSNRITEMQCCALVPYIKYIQFSFALKFISFDNYIRCNVRKIECWNNASNQVNYFQTGTINWNWPINSDVRFNRKWIIIFTLFIFVRVVVANKFILFFSFFYWPGFISHHLHPGFLKTFHFALEFRRYFVHCMINMDGMSEMLKIELTFLFLFSRCWKQIGI